MTVSWYKTLSFEEQLVLVKLERLSGIHLKMLILVGICVTDKNTFFHFQLIVALFGLTSSMPVESTEATLQMPKLQLAFLVEDVDYSKSFLEKLKKNILKTEKKTKNKKIVPFIEENEILGDFDRKYRSAFKEEIFNSKLRNKQRRLVRSSER